MARARHRRKSKHKGIFIGVLLCIIACFVAIFFLLPEETKENMIKQTPKLKIVDLDSKTRPFAVMIDNSDAAFPNHTGLQDAFITYEIITEGGISRIMALFKDQTTDLIGPVRSSRHYFLDYALENDAIYAHFGWSDRARDDISSLAIDNLNGITNATKAYWRDSNFVAPHNVYTKISNLQEVSEEKEYQLKTDDDLLLNYSVKEISLAKKTDVKVANQVSIDYSTYHNTSYTYDPTAKVYLRKMNGQPHTDYATKKQYSVKNIIVTKIKNNAFDDYGRQDLENIGEGDGYFITDGYAIPIQWKKTSRRAKTQYVDMTGKEIVVNDGNTAIQIQPIDQEVNITE